MDLKSKIREIPDWPKPGVNFKDITTLLEDKEELRKVHAELYALKNTLGIPGASRRAAEEIAKLLG